MLSTMATYNKIRRLQDVYTISTTETTIYCNTYIGYDPKQSHIRNEQLQI